MRSPMMVSVIIPMYNSARYVAETIHSVLASTYTDIEVVCIDDGSADNSADIAEQIAATDSRVKVLRQPNGGVCRARNAAIRASHGEYILPVDADDVLMPQFIADAVAVLSADSDVKVVVPSAEFFGARSGQWSLRPYSPHLLARKNMLPATAMYRRTDYQRIGGYCTELKAREDWEFWISMLENGGKVVTLPGIGLKYRIHQFSKRVADRKLKRHVVEVLNRRHPDFFEEQLGGPLHLHRSWSRMLNALYRLLHPRKVFTMPQYAQLHTFIATLPARFRFDAGKVIYRGRNELRTFHTVVGNVVVKSFCTPNIINRIAYGLLRASKAERSCTYADKLRSIGIGSPAPVGWCTERSGLLFTRSYYASMQSALPHTYIDIIKGNTDAHTADLYLLEIGRTAAKMHQAGMIHRDFSRGNILLGIDDDGKALVEIIDLNRIRFHEVSIAEGIANFNRLPANEHMKRIMAEGYAEVRGFSAEECLKLWPHTEDISSPEAGTRF